MNQVLEEGSLENKSELIRKACNYSKEVHKGQKRLSGDDYFVHCFEVAKILNELGLDEETIAAGFLHDVLEDSKISYEDLKREFGEDVANLVDGVTKINILKKKSTRTNNSETVRKMLVSAAEDIRVIIIKLADRLHNMRTLEFLSGERQKKLSRQCLDIYAPLAYRLGLASIKWELEDLSFSFLEPEIYEDFRKKMAKSRSVREKEIEGLVKVLGEELKKHNLDVKILGRPKHFYSIYKKMRLKNKQFEDVYDLIGLRVITDSVEECYEVLGVVHNFWKLIPGRLKDYIANPKPHFYQSLHTGVLTEDNQKVEIQIRTKQMHELAEEGIAAHWKYKGRTHSKKFDKSLSWLRQILDFSKESPSKFMKTLRVDLFGDNIFCFTPKGDIIELPSKSTPIDFAYSVHSDIGERCVGARVNDKFVSLKYELKTGDVIEILTSKQHRPSRDWLKFVRSSKALERIKKSLKIHQGIPAKTIKILDKEEKIKRDIISISGLKNFETKLSGCCNPLPGDDIVGYVNKTKNKVIVHTSKCSNLGKVKREFKEVKWSESFDKELKLRIFALERVGIFADVLNTIAATGTSVKSATARAIDDYNAECILTIKFDGLNHLRDIIDRVNRIADV
ncbi:MAG: bifunctional (p)ppGpp synthetase/guanosine-3',5'-bis(diphosphate) 3'-pyrophosphohydrolase, partial [Nanoarchaeota archaeon]|nr:bifunctional (p)ppGpp synthetase/guanosine-3',5'-bis(diphosphate) 3'-pyrophosphohydrolase [Nanoarchaeota archaeon]